MSLFGSSSNNNSGDEHVIANPPDDTVSRLRFNPNPQNGQQFICSGSWANDVRIWQIATQQQSSGGFSSSGSNVKMKIETQPKAMKSQGGPVLDVCWKDDSSKVFSVGADKKAMMWDLGADSFNQIGAHEQPITCCGFAKGPNYECLVTGSLDKTVKLWDMRQSNPVMTFNCPERVYALDIMGPVMVVVTADRKLLAYQMHPEPKEWQPFQSQLKQQIRCVCLFKNKEGTDPSGFAYGSIEGRTALHNFKPLNPKDDFTFKCHRGPQPSNRDPQDIYPVNGISFHPKHHGLLATVGSDGKYSFWDKENRTKLLTSSTNTQNDPKQSISCCDVDSEGKLFAYAVGYDWHRGHECNDPNTKPKIVLRNIFNDMKPKSKS